MFICDYVIGIIKLFACVMYCLANKTQMSWFFHQDTHESKIFFTYDGTILHFYGSVIILENIGSLLIKLFDHKNKRLYIHIYTNFMVLLPF